MLPRVSVPFYANPLAYAAALEMSALLDDLGYSAHARDRIVRHAVATGTLAGCPELEPDDEAAVTEAFVSALPDVPRDRASWDRADAVLDVRMMISGTHPTPSAAADPAVDAAFGAAMARLDAESGPLPDPPVLIDPTGRDRGILHPAERAMWDGLIAHFSLPDPEDEDTGEWPAPIAGGSPEADRPRMPSDEDWADFRSWIEFCDRLDDLNADREDR